MICITSNSLKNTFILGTVAALGLGHSTAHAQVLVQFNTPLLIFTSSSSAQTGVFSGTVTNPGSATIAIRSARVPSFLSDSAGDRVLIDVTQNFGFTPYFPSTVTPDSFLNVTIPANQPAGLYNIPSDVPNSLPALKVTFSDGETTSTTFVVQVLPAPEPSQYAALGIGLLGLGALAFKARRRHAAA